jgi:hypothetical protein
MNATSIHAVNYKLSAKLKRCKRKIKKIFTAENAENAGGIEVSGFAF